MIDAASKLRTCLEFTGTKRWPDLNVRLQNIQDLASEVTVGAWRTALLGEAVLAAAARDLASAASVLASTAAKDAQLEDGGFSAEVYQAGQIVQPPDFAEFDRRLDAFLAVAGS
ncbi:hypothetical protein [Actinocorallia longicatena]